MRTNATLTGPATRQDDHAPAPRRTAGVDFARLLRRVRALPEPMRGEDDGDAIASTPPSRHTASDPIDPTPECATATGGFDMRIAGSGFVEAAAHSEAQSAALCSTIAQHVANFCANPAVLTRGNWMLRVTLDPRLLPHCTLQLDLSYLRLILRFETRDTDTRAIVLRHVDVLKANLSAMLQRHAMVYDLEITVW